MITDKAYKDAAFLEREELRAVKMQLEMLRPNIIMDEEGIKSTAVIFGSARISENHKMSKWYDVARDFANLVSNYGKSQGPGEFVVTTGGGPGIMEAGNRGAAEAGGLSCGLSITLPFETCSNKYVTDGLDFLFNYFSVRKMHFLIRAKAVAVMPGGFGTLDELMELLTLVQTQRMDPMPIILFNKKFWNSVINFEYLVEQGVISEADLSLFKYAETGQEGLAIIEEFYK